MKTENELQALTNSLEYFSIKSDINTVKETDKRKKTKFVLSKKDKFYSPKMNFNEMNRFIHGVAMAKEIDF